MSRITSSTLDRRLSEALSGETNRAPMPEGLMRVPDGWVRGRPTTGLSRRAFVVGGIVALAAATTMAVLAIVGGLGDWGRSVGTDEPPPDAAVPIQTLDLEPRVVPIPVGGEAALGPVVEVARGAVRGMGPWSYVVYRGEELVSMELGAVCLFFEWPGGTNGGCGGAMPGEPGTIGEVFGAGGESHAPGAGVVHEYSGIVATHVAEVWIETDAGTRARATLIPLDAAGIDAQLFTVFLPARVDSTAWVALDANGTEIGRIPDVRPAESNGPPTPDPTPEG
jgi:hypothetical protein